MHLYIHSKLSEVQIGSRLTMSNRKVRRILDKHKIKRRSISEAISFLYITKFGKKPFRLRENLTEKDQILKAAGAMLYWGEGAKSNGSVAFSNSDPSMVTLFLHFLRRVCGIQEGRLRITLHYYQDQDLENLIAFWSKLTNVPRSHFYKSFLHMTGKKGTYKSRASYGTVSVQYSDKKLLTVILDWIREYQKVLS